MQNNPIKTIFVCEFITGGGLHHSDLPKALAMQGALMRDALLSELSMLAYQISTTVDARLEAPNHCDICREVAAAEDVWQLWEDEISKVDAVWVIAPETDGYLERVTAIALKQNKRVIGCDLKAVRAFSRKFETYQLLERAGIQTIPTYMFRDWQGHAGTAWLAKPNDGAGCEETVCFAQAKDLERWIVKNNKQKTHVIQPFLMGDVASASCVMHQGQAYLLSCNEQHVIVKNNVLHFEGCVVNGLQQYWEAFTKVANGIAQLLPGIAGYVGLDLIVGDSGITVVEVNPRLTTSYVALPEAAGYNIAELIMQLITQQGMQASDAFPLVERNVVKLEMSQHHA